MKARRLLGMSVIGGLVTLVMATVAVEVRSQTEPDCNWSKVSLIDQPCKQFTTFTCVGCGVECESGDIYTQATVYGVVSGGSEKTGSELVGCSQRVNCFPRHSRNAECYFYTCGNEPVEDVDCDDCTSTFGEASFVASATTSSEGCEGG